MRQGTVRDVPEDVVRALREEARERGQSMNAVARSALEEHVARQRWRRHLEQRLPAMDALRERIERRAGGELAESVSLIREDRAR